jgi:vacuolar-type H+-ATPase subunit H
LPTMNDPSNNPSQDFELIRSKLGDPDVLSFINSLIDQNSNLASKLEQIDALKKLAEEQVGIARAEVERIIEEAKQIAEKNAQEKLSVAQQQAQEIVRAAEEQASTIISEAKQKAEAVAWQARQILSSAKEEAEKEALLIRQEAQQLQLKTKTPSEGHIEQTSAVNPKKSQPDPRTVEEVEQVMPTSSQEGENKQKTTGFYGGTVELVIAPPISPGPLLTFGRQLKRTKQISILGMKGSLTQGIKVRLFLRNRIPLFDVLKAIPQVEEVSGELKKASLTRNPTETREELSIRSILLRLKS